jgi:hypothetical protein
VLKASGILTSRSHTQACMLQQLFTSTIKRYNTSSWFSSSGERTTSDSHWCQSQLQFSLLELHSHRHPKLIVSRASSV